MPDRTTFEAVITGGSRGGAAVEIPFDVEAVFGRRRVPVKASFDGVAYRGSIVFMGGRPVLGITRAIRSTIGKDVGDTVTVQVEADSAPRVFDLPKELSTAFDARPELRARFDALAYTHRREYATWIAEAKRPDTRERRVAKALKMLDEGRTRS